MFSSREQLRKHTPKNGVDREEYINSLVDEFLQTKSLDAKRQILANLANFAYDPINFKFLRDSGALDIFIHQISQKEGQNYTPKDQDLLHFAVSGLSNLCLDPLNADHIVKYDGINLLINLITSDYEETVLSAITTLIFLADRIPRDIVTKPEIVKQFLEFKDKSNSPRLRNLANVFLEDVCKYNAVINNSEIT